MTDTHDLIRWAYDVFDQSRSQTRNGWEPARWEVGQGVVDRLLATVPHRDEDDEDGPRTTRNTLLGVPLDIVDTLGPCGWRTLDMFGKVLVSGTLVAAGVSGG